MTFSFSNCIVAPGQEAGARIGIYRSCDFSNEVFCTSMCTLEPVVVSSELLEVGETYSVFVDGCDDTVCDVFIDINGDYTTLENRVIGQAFVDSNENGIFDDNEQPLKNVQVSIPSDDMIVLTDDEGRYSLEVVESNFDLEAVITDGEWEEETLIIQNASLENGCGSSFDFGFVPLNNTQDQAMLSISNSIARCDGETRFDILVENTGSEPLKGTLTFTFDDKTTFSRTMVEDFVLNGNIFTTNIENIAPFSSEVYEVRLFMPGGSSLLPLLAFEAVVTNTNGAILDEYAYQEQLRCSYDPNDKRTFPDREGDENLTLFEEELEYTIRFQNNGNDTAFVVTIVDSIDPNIDPSTISVVNSSHDVEACIDGSELIFRFEDILLVDSTTNFDASQGYVSYRCRTFDGLGEMTPVFNQADIIFDTNDPIVTNETINTMVSVLCVDKDTMLSVSICEGETFNDYTESGIYLDTFPLPFGCDSIVILELEVQEISFSEANISLCEGGSFSVNGVTYELEESTVIVDSVFNAAGCLTSIATFNVELLLNPVISGIDVLCIGASAVLESNETGTWFSNDPAVIIIDNTGAATAIGQGITELVFTDVNGCSSSIEIQVLPDSDPSCITSTNEIEESVIHVFPIPTSDQVSITTEIVLTSLQIVNAQGQSIDRYENVRNGKHDINVSAYPSGLYFMIMKAEDKTATRRFVVE